MCVNYKAIWSLECGTPYFSQCKRPDEGSSDEIDELRNSLAELSDQLDAFGIQIEELSTDMESQNEKNKRRYWKFWRIWAIGRE